MSKIGFVIDSIDQINPAKDTTLSMVTAAFERGLEVFLLDAESMSFCVDINNKKINKKINIENKSDNKSDNKFQNIFSKSYKILNIKQSARFILDYNLSLKDVVDIQEISKINYLDFDYIIMRKDPPVDANYIYITYFLEYLSNNGVKVFNNPRSLRDVNEKCFILNFPELISPSLVSNNISNIMDFLDYHKKIVVKPLNEMGGAGIIALDINKDDKQESLNKISNMIKKLNNQMIMAQKFLDVNRLGDKRVLLINSKPVGYALARFPKKGGFLANLAAGGSGKVVPLTAKDYEICYYVKDILKNRGLSFVGLDIVDDHLTEVNVTSPTCVREINTEHNLDISGDYIDFILSFN